MLRHFTSLLGLTILGTLASDLPAAEVDPELPEYQPSAHPMSGAITSVGSDALNNLLTLWAEGFTPMQAGVNIQIEGRGGDTAESALISGLATIGLKTMLMAGDTVDAFTRRWGYPPTCIMVALDALAVLVHQDNPVPSLTLAQVDAAFSSTRRRGGADILTWGDVGVGGAWGALPVALYGRNSASGTFGFFKMAVLEKGDFKKSVREQPGSRAVVDQIAADPAGMGYVDSGYTRPGARAVPLADAAGVLSAPTTADILTGRYPLQRSFRLYVNRPPGGSPHIDAFLRFVLSKQGQVIVAKLGHTALTAAMAAEQRRLIE